MVIPLCVDPVDHGGQLVDLPLPVALSPIRPLGFFTRSFTISEAQAPGRVLNFEREWSEGPATAPLLHKYIAPETTETFTTKRQIGHCFFKLVFSPSVRIL